MENSVVMNVIKNIERRIKKMKKNVIGYIKRKQNMD